jgi:hypothetical protein
MLISPELKKIPIFSCLNDANLMRLSQQAADLHLEPGEYLIHEAEPTPLFVVMDGTTEVLKDVMGRRTELGLHSVNAKGTPQDTLAGCSTRLIYRAAPKNMPEASVASTSGIMAYCTRSAAYVLINGSDS